ncbi:MAG: Uma2 family endonuclease [Bacteroidetes bacterium]|nr:MAG: Uma2 family endonuclease [Bacteroidota bacterium]
MKITQLSQLDLTKSYTIGDYLSWQFDEMVELIKGKIYNMSPAPRSKHQAISGNVYSEIYTLLKRKKCKVFHAPFDVYLKGMESDKDTVVQPDICIICDKSKIGEFGCIGAPDMIIEILSPSSMKRDLDYKFHLYEENGVKEYWIISPEYKQISIYILKENLYEHLGDFTTDDEYVFIHTLEQEKIKTSDIFEF